ncbi:MAG: Bug family tripartite tricarboxylate transporter substrate binding protein [Paracoccus sp. (in: a-proteobacteria)]|jgi:putative tricarboxylic transport membrane protein|uniref:Bug family tripartite tricarboxylate transporter substrate binding protein n=2 Tax=Paracoccus TaxID=265 RepID=UPI000C65A791|nr:MULTISPECIES: tripartite tricarboxylate transporter substrate-binding protein [unclassified Paracoccus (in: a-proteobacteria)]MAN57590.1 C4-dicarboxylate ABC transporter substrate-binding protein [Paracoccus sp. (in: a-proteobacteria)]MBA49070.1 C4-dicarboxylate ABC transporter substrate-binding protein [Paracoccus sp. (in: a-proteobacteria)]MCS5600997.1 tripartite tricarboxylate transporter substrate-binding protein [Paracoccus sp. (in: a-proteobacteria)]HIC64390.1 tripartite tricarboxylate|tara:strand:- start:5323 stop:6288 length:966 start_codon:yes stop_codon:yes gene_type:complete
MIWKLNGLKVAGIGAAMLFALPALGAECIAPADPGGGWDFTCREVGRLLSEEKLVDGNVQVTNMPGGVGAVAWANVASKRADDPELIVATSTVGVTQIAQGKYPSDIGTMRWLAMLGADVGIIAVAKDSPYESLDQLLEALKADPASVVTSGSTGAGGWDHIRLMMLAQAAGIEDLTGIRWVQFDGGGPAVTQMMGGQVQVVSADLGEIKGFVESGDIRVLAVLSDQPVSAFPDLPTAKSQGYDVTGYNWRGFYTGGDVSDEDYQAWVDKLQKLYESDGWQETARSSGLEPIWRGGQEFADYVAQQEKEMADISRRIGVIQ